MKKWVEIIAAKARQEERIILGLMSGTSMDGIDLVLCRIRGASAGTELEILEKGSADLDPRLRERFQRIAFRPDTPLGEAVRFGRELGEAWCRAIDHQLRSWGMDRRRIDLLASHGQTLLHLPDPENSLHATLQVVDGDLLALRLGLITVSDFRSGHIAAGFEGAPLVPLGEMLLFTHPTEERILLNLGGIGNFTWLRPGGEEGIPFATDTGPANTLIDEAVRRLYPGLKYDEGGALARSGTIHSALLEELQGHPFFERPFPKSTGQEEFNWEWVYRCLLNVDPGLKSADLLATLTEFTARTVADAIKRHVGTGRFVIYVSGGGWHNSHLRERIGALLPGADLRSSSDLGLDPDAKEAAIFAVLANERIAGSGWVAPDGSRFTVGKISLPGGSI